MAPRYCTLPELAKELGVSKDTIYKAAKAGTIPGAFQVGPRRWRVNKDAFEAATAAAGQMPVQREAEAS